MFKYTTKSKACTKGGNALKYRIRWIFSAACAVLMTVLGIFVCKAMLSPPEIFISEVCSAADERFPSAVHYDDNGDPCDWIELYNPSDETVSLKDFYLRIDGGSLFPLGSSEIAPQNYLLIFCSKNAGISSSVSYVNFNIPKYKDSVIDLFYGSRLCRSAEVCRLEKGDACSFDEDGKAYVSDPTPMRANSTVKKAGTVSFSRESGFYSEEFQLEITPLTENQSVYYTADGTDPAVSETRKLYSAPIRITDRKGDKNVLSAYDPMKIQLDYREGKVHTPAKEDVDKCTVIRACAESSDGKCGITSSATYLVGLSPEDHNSMAVMSIITDPYNLYDDTYGIYCRGDAYAEYYPDHPTHPYNGSIPANYNQKGRDWERECYVEFFETDGSLKVSQDAGMRIHGGWSRADYQKSLRLFARGSYGRAEFEYPFWQELVDAEGKIHDSFETLVLRNGGNDSNYLKYKDIMFQDMVGERNFSTQNGRPCVVFIDGEYWGHYILQEDYSKEFFETHYGVNKDDVAIYKSNELDEGLLYDEVSFEKLRRLICDNDMSIKSNYKKVCELLDVDNFADYSAAEAYLYNEDWPQNNYGCWRTRTIDEANPYADGKWRFFMFDTESSAYHYNSKSADVSYYEYLEKHNDTVLGGILCSLLDSPDFREKFLTSLMDMGNICYDYTRVGEFQERYNKVYLSEMEAFFKRFPVLRTVENSSMPMLMRMNSFFSGRKKTVISDSMKYFGIDSPIKLGIESQNGSVKVNGSEVKQSFKGNYFQGSILTLTAAGNDFSHWEITVRGKKEIVDSPEISLTLDADTAVSAFFDCSFW